MLEMFVLATLSGSIVCAALLCLKNRLLHAVGGRVYCALCILAMLVFLMPMRLGGFSNGFAVLSSRPLQTEAAGENVYAPQEASQGTELYADTDVESGGDESTVPEKSDFWSGRTLTLQEILLAIWLAGAIASLCRYLFSYRAFYKRAVLGKAAGRIGRVGLISTDMVHSPMLIGFFRPRLLIPKVEMNKTEYMLMLRHELAHYRHKDAWLKLFAVFINATQWFNPLAYLMVKTVGEACEYACDELVVRGMDMDGRKSYSEMILNMVCQSSPALANNMAKNKKQLFRRFDMIMTKKKWSKLTVALCVAASLTVGMCGVALANGFTPAAMDALSGREAYVMTSGNGQRYTITPAEKDGVYYLPLREFLNMHGIDNSKIKFENGKVTTEIWTEGATVYLTSMSETENEDGTRTGHLYTETQPKLMWTTEVTEGSKEIVIDGRRETLSVPPEIADDTMYVPYEYFAKLRDFEQRRNAELLNDDSDNATSVSYSAAGGAVSAIVPVKIVNGDASDEQPEESRSDFMTSVFSNLSITVYNKLSDEYISDTAYPNNRLPDERDVCFCFENSSARLSKTGTRTEFSMTSDYYGANNTDAAGSVELTLNKVNRVFSKGSDLEGLFTLKLNGETVYENEKGYINNLLNPTDGGITVSDYTEISVADFSVRVPFLEISDDWGKANGREVSIVNEFPNTVKKWLHVDAKPDFAGEATQAGRSYIVYNPEEKWADLNVTFIGDWDEENQTRYRLRVMRAYNFDAEFTDDGFSGIFFVCGGINGDTRIDSFEGEVSGLESGNITLKSADGKYVLHGETGDWSKLYEKESEFYPIGADASAQ